MSLVKNLIQKCSRNYKVVLRLPLLFLCYCFYVLSCHKLFSHRLHDFSQLFLLVRRLHLFHGMTSASEQAYFQWYAKHIYTGSGEIVDLGCWLGSTTIPLAIGLVKNPNSKASAGKIYAYDNFIWQSWMDESVAGTPLDGKYQDGDSFLEEFSKRIGPGKDRIRVHAGDLRQIAWDGGKIEFLLIDAMKSWELANSIVRAFYPALIPGSSFVLHQDFAHWYTSWIHLLHYRFRQYFDMAYDIPHSTSIVFKLRKSLPSQLTTKTYSLSSFKASEIHSAFDYSLSLVCKNKRPNVAAAKVMLFIHLGDLSQAQRELDKCRSEGLTFASDLSIVESIIEERHSNSF